MSRWTAANIPSQSGKLALITGANSGIGFQAARELARAGATVILACRDLKKAEAARKAIAAEIAGAKVEVGQLDLASLASVRTFAEIFKKSGRKLNLLVNNAGVMAPRTRKTTADGFELQFGTNHLGHFALTALLLPTIAETGRIVTVASIAHRGGKLRFDDLNAQTSYNPFTSYNQSKIANLYFGFELQRRLEKAGKKIASIVVHPGVASTNLIANGIASGNKFFERVATRVSGLFLQSDEKGALPTLYGATSPDAHGGKYYGPDGFREAFGYPVEVKAVARTYDAEIAAKLWSVSEELSGTDFAVESSKGRRAK